MPKIDLSMLNQRQTPAFYADVLANRPAAGFIGRIFVSTNTFAFYRDNGTGWDLIGGPGTGTITGSGATGQVSYWNGASTITGSNDLFFDAVNGHLGIGTVTPGTALDVKHDQSTVVQLEQITATNDIRIAFINSGVGLWRLGAFYNAGANDFGLFDIAAAAQPVTVKRTTGQVLIGTSTVGSGKLVVASSTGDNGVQIVGASAPSLRIDNAESGPTKRAGFGISTATNNFIQGSADRDFCMFNGSTTASPILFGIYGTTNVQEAARISAARNFLIGTTTDGGYKLSVNGTGYINDRLTIDGTTTTQYIQFYNSGTDRAHLYWNEGINSLTIGTYVAGGGLKFETGNNTQALIINSSQNSAFVGDVTVGRKFGSGGAAATYSITAYNSNNGTTAAFGGTSKGIRIDNDGTFSSGRNTIFSVDTTFFGSYQPLSIEASVMSLQALTGGNVLIGTTTDSGQKLQVNGTSYLNGNLGLQITSSPWVAGTTALDFGTKGEITTNGDYVSLGNNRYLNSSGQNIYKTTDFASILVQTDGQFQFFSAPSGTAGNVITFTQSMTLSANGNLLIGTATNGSSKLRIVGLPTSAAGLSSGDVYSNAGILTIVP